MGRGTAYPFVTRTIAELIRQGGTVLETGCGSAVYRDVIANMNAAYVGVDVPNDHYQDGGEVDVHCSADMLPFRDESFDLIFCQGAMDYFPNRSVCLRESYRVLKPGGVFLIFTYREDVLREIDRNCRETARDWERHHDVFTIEQLSAETTDAGFSVTEMAWQLAMEPVGRRERWKSHWAPAIASKWLEHTIWRGLVARKARRWRWLSR